MFHDYIHVLGPVCHWRRLSVVFDSDALRPASYVHLHLGWPDPILPHAIHQLLLQDLHEEACQPNDEDEGTLECNLTVRVDNYLLHIFIGL